MFHSNHRARIYGHYVDAPTERLAPDRQVETVHPTMSTMSRALRLPCLVVETGATRTVLPPNMPAVAVK